MSTVEPHEIPCPWCLHTNTAHDALGYPPGTKPGQLDVSLCMQCGQWSLFCVHDEEIHLIKPPGGLGYAHIINVLQSSVA